MVRKPTGQTFFSVHNIISIIWFYAEEHLDTTVWFRGLPILWKCYTSTRHKPISRKKLAVVDWKWMPDCPFKIEECFLRKPNRFINRFQFQPLHDLLVFVGHRHSLFKDRASKDLAFDPALMYYQPANIMLTTHAKQ